MADYYYRGPTMDHGLLSPSGRVSKRARKAALAREHERLFRGVDLSPTTAQPAEAERLRRQAATLLGLAERGMSPRKFRKEAARLLATAERLGVTP